VALWLTQPQDLVVTAPKWIILFWHDVLVGEWARRVGRLVGMETRDVAEAMLAVLESGTVEERVAVVSGLNASEPVLIKAVGDEWWEVRWAAAGNVNASERVLMKALEDEGQWVRWAAAGNAAASERVLMKALGDKEPVIRRAAAGNVNASERVLMRAMGDEDEAVRMTVARSPRVPYEVADELLKSRLLKVAEALAANEALPERIRVAARLKAGL
jgi:hypothetical protein